MSKHTEGPWFTDGRKVFSEPEQKLIATCAEWTNTRHGSTPLNARLIASAPELLAFVESITQMRPLSHDEFTKRYGYSQAAIAEAAAQLITKAEGKPVPA